MRIEPALLEPIPILYLPAIDGPAGARRAFEILESRIDNMKRTRFYGAMHRDGTYGACVARRNSDEAAPPECHWAELPGGAYVRTMLSPWQDLIPRIAETVDRMAENHSHNPSGPSLECYRSERDVILLLPVQPAVSHQG